MRRPIMVIAARRTAGRRDRRASHLGIAATVLLAGLLAAGCAAPGPAPGSPEARLFGPLPRPDGFDAQRAAITLPQIPEAPTAPPKSETAQQVELPRQALQRLIEARRLFAEQRFTETITELNTALRYQAAIGEAHRMLALANMFSGNAEQAKVHAERALELQPDDLACRYVLGRLAEQAANHSEALRQYRTALLCAATPEVASYRTLTHYRLGSLLEQDGYYAAAADQLAAFCKAAGQLGPQGPPDNPELATVLRVNLASAYMALARSQGLLDQYAAAAETLETALRLAPKDSILRSEWVCMLGRAGRWPQAEQAAAAFVADSGGIKASIELLLAVYRAEGRPAAAVARLQELVARQPDNVELKLYYVDALLADKRLSEAAKVLAEVSAQSPDRPEVRLKLITLSRAQGDWTSWIETLARELADRPADLDPIEDELAQVSPDVALNMLAQRRQPAGPSIPQAQRLPDLDGPSAAALDYLLARLAQRLDQPDQARELLINSARLGPDFVPTALALARINIDAFRWAEAMSFLENAAAQVGKPSAEIEMLFARCHEGLDQNAQAIERYNKAIEIDPANVPAMFRLARLYERMGDARATIRQYEAIIAADGSNLLAREGFIRAVLSAGDQSQMMRLVDQIAQMQRLAPDSPATQRCLAMIRLLQPGKPDLQAYISRLRELVAAFPDDPRNREELIASAVALRDYQTAQAQIDELLKRDPHSERGREMQVFVTMRQLDYEAAARILQQMLTWYPNRASWLTELAQIRMFDRDYEGAIALWKRLIDLAGRQEKPDRSRLAYRARLMQAYRDAGRYDEARTVAQQWLTETPDPAKSAEARTTRDQIRWFLLAADSVARQNDRYLERVRGWLEEEPDNRLLQAWLLGVPAGYPQGTPGLPPGSPGLMGAQRYDEALLLILEWLADKPDAGELIDWMMLVLQAAGRHDEAVELATSEVAVASGTEQRISQLTVLRDVYQRARRYDLMIETGKQVVSEIRKLLVEIEAQRQGIAEVYLFEQQRQLAILMALAEHYEDAVAQLRQMLKQADEFRREAESVIEQGQAEPARRLQAMRQAQQARQRQIVLLRGLSFVYQQQENYEQAETAGRDAYRLMPNDVGLNNDLGYLLADAGKDLDEAQKMIRLAAGEDPDQAAYLDSLGWVLYKQGNTQDARKWLLRATAVEDGQDAVIYDHLGDTQWRLGQHDEAVRCWQRSIELYEEKVRAGELNVDDRHAARTRQKLTAVEKQQPPEVAAIPPATQAATQTAPQGR